MGVIGLSLKLRDGNDLPAFTKHFTGKRIGFKHAVEISRASQKFVAKELLFEQYANHGRKDSHPLTSPLGLLVLEFSKLSSRPHDNPHGGNDADWKHQTGCHEILALAHRFTPLG
jgi:hypothetical protein